MDFGRWFRRQEEDSDGVPRIAFQGNTHEGYLPLGAGADSRTFVTNDASSILKWYKELQDKIQLGNVLQVLEEYVRHSREAARACLASPLRLLLPSGHLQQAHLHILPQGEIAVAADGIACTHGQPFVRGTNLIDLYHKGSQDPVLNGYRGNNSIYVGNREILRTLSDRIGPTDRSLNITPLNVIPQIKKETELHLYVTDLCDNLANAYQDVVANRRRATLKRIETRTPFLAAIRDARPGDGQSIARITKEGWLFAYANEKVGLTVQDIDSKGFDGLERVSSWERQIESAVQGTRIFIAHTETETIGYCKVEKTATGGMLNALYVLPKFHQGGTGSRLLRDALEWIGEGRQTDVSVLNGNAPAIRFYVKHGFLVIGTSKMRIARKDLTCIDMRKNAAEPS